MSAIHYELIDGGKRGRLLSPLGFNTDIIGYDVTLPDNPCQIYSDGYLLLGAGFVWDFGSYAVDTPGMVFASAAHDALCVMTDRGLLPWKVRGQSDRLFRLLLAESGVPAPRRWWCWAGVRGYSKTVAYWKRKK
jgi:hypothetical protein